MGMQSKECEWWFWETLVVEEEVLRRKKLQGREELCEYTI